MTQSARKNTARQRKPEAARSKPAAIDRVMQTYGMMVNLTSVQEAAAREKVSNFFA
jgi:hypothetical protein